MPFAAKSEMVSYFLGVYIINRTLHVCLEIGNFSSDVKKTFHSIAVLTHEIFFNTRRENFLSLHSHVISSIFEGYALSSSIMVKGR